MKWNYYLLAIIAFGFLCQCKTKQVQTVPAVTAKVEMANGHEVVLLDSTSAATAIITDEKDRFFDRVTFTEMSIQMKEKRNCADRKSCVAKYQEFLKTDVESFTAEEEAKVSAVFAEVKDLITIVNPALIDRDIILIKTKGNHYGDGVYYTRENKIIIPQDALTKFNEKQFLETMLHEFFHIFSRYNKETRDKMYALIGFSEVEGKLDFGSKGSRKLLNPDGTTHYYIDLKEHGKAYPLITATEDHFVTEKPTFFSYLDFHLYGLEDGEDGIVKVRDQIEFNDAPSFFKQIKDNTNYIIHPDEIMADNFIYTVFYLARETKLKSFSDEGMKLIDEIGQLLKDYN